MKIKMILVLFSLMVAFVLFKFAVAPACATDADMVTVGQGESLADKVLEASNEGGVMTVAPGASPNPKASRSVWSNRTGVNFTMPSTLSSGANSAKESRNQAESTATTQDQTVNSQDTTQTPPAQTADQTLDQTPIQTDDQTASTSSAMAGSWSFELSDNTVKEVVLTLFQSEDAVFGTGSMKDGNSTLLVAASGSNEGDKLNLDITSYGSINLYRLALTSSGDSASGDYKAFSANGQSWTGSAQGTRSS